MSYTYAEFFCPVHGRFEAFVSRPVPDHHPCTASAFVETATDCCEDCAGLCGIESPWCISAPLGRVKRGEVTQGKVSKAERKTWTDTEMLADRGAWKEWKAKRKAVWQEHRWNQNRKDGRKGMA